MAVIAQHVTDRYAVYNGDSAEVMANLPEGRVHLSVYSPPFGGLYNYSSHDRDLSNCTDYAEFFEHYAFFVRGLLRITMPGRMTAVHAMDIPSGNSGGDHLIDFSGDIIRLHEREGWRYVARYAIWKEPLKVRMRTLAKGLAHRTVVEDATRCSNASADYLLVFRAPGENPTPVVKRVGFLEYAGARKIPTQVLRFKGHTGSHLHNQYSHWIWRQYASAFWDDIRIERVLPFQDGKDADDEKHVHPLQLDVIERVVHLWSNPGETVLTPFMGVGSEVYAAVRLGRRGVGVELKPSYYRQALKNLATVDFADSAAPERSLFSALDDGDEMEDQHRQSAPVATPGSFSQGAVAVSGDDAGAWSKTAKAKRKRGGK